VSRAIALLFIASLTSFAERASAESEPLDPASLGATHERKDIRFWMDSRDVTRPRCGGCARPTWLHIGSYELRLYAPAGLRFERFIVGGEGRVTITGISPDGRTAHATLRPGNEPGHHKVIAVFRRKGEVFTSTKRFRVRPPHRGHDCEPSPCSDPVGYPNEGRSLADVPRGPPPTCRLRSRGRLRFTADGATVYGAWPQKLRFAVALPAPTRWALGVPDGGPPPAPTVECTTGRLLSVKRAPEIEGSTERFRVELSSLPSDTDGWLVAGKHRCTVTYDLTDGRRTRTRSGTLRFTIDRHGQMRTAAPICPKRKPPPKGDLKRALPEPTGTGIDRYRH
jgi:hypothetical protein